MQQQPSSIVSLGHWMTIVKVSRRFAHVAFAVYPARFDRTTNNMDEARIRPPIPSIVNKYLIRYSVPFCKVRGGSMCFDIRPFRLTHGNTEAVVLRCPKRQVLNFACVSNATFHVEGEISRSNPMMLVSKLDEIFNHKAVFRVSPKIREQSHPRTRGRTSAWRHAKVV